MPRSSAVLLAIFGALVCGITLAAGHRLASIHISTAESIGAGIIAAIGIAMMMRAFQSTRSGAVIVVEAVTLGLIWAIYAFVLSISVRVPEKQTMADLRTIGTALEARATDLNSYPPARDIDDLALYLEPTYIRQVPRRDGFRNKIRYEAWQGDPHAHGPDHYAIASAGRDWKWERGSLREYPKRGNTDSDCDIVFSDGAFIVYPDEAASTGPAQWPQQTTTDPKATFDNATARYRSGNYAEAVPLFQQYLRVSPDDALANARLGASLSELGKLRESVPYLQKASRLDATDYQSRSNLGLVYEQLNRPSEGVEWERQADKIKPNDPAVLNNLGWVLFRAGHRDEAIGVFERAVQLAPNEPRYRDNLLRARSGGVK